MLGEIASDNTLAGGESATDVIGIQEIDDMIHTPVNSNLRDLWGWMYGGVNRANFILEFQDKTDFSGKDQVIAQARFLRAYYYFELVKWFGDVPLAIDKQILFGEESSYERSPASEVYSLIEQDLIYAADKLPSVASETAVEETGRVTKGAAQALLGKAYLYQDKFSEALKWINSLLNDIDIDQSQEVYSSAEILNLFIHFELDNKDLVRYTLKSTKRFLKTRNKLFEYETLVLNFMQKTTSYNFDNYELDEVLSQFISDLKKVTSDTFENIPFESFNCILWAESKVKKQKFSLLTREKK